MRDKDDPARTRPGSRLGKLIYTEFDSAPERAEYALPLGEPALQGCGSEFDSQSSSRAHPLMSRRRVLLLGLIGGFSVGSALVWGFGRSGSPVRFGHSPEPMNPGVPDAPTQFMMDGARVVARKPIDDLVRVHAMYLWLVAHHGARDAALWDGVQRLAQWSLLDREHRGVELARRLIPVLKIASSPGSMAAMRIELEALVWEWDQGRRTP